MTLDEIEHQILRPLGEPRIHAAIVCASISCPSLRREAYRGERLEAQLEDALRRFLADPRKGSRLEAEAGVLRLSPIFDWFAGGLRGAGRRAGLPRAAAPRSERPRARASGATSLALRYFDYDWRLNDTASAP